MKKTYSLFPALFCAGLLFGQNTQVSVNNQGQTVSISQATSFHKTTPLRTWPSSNATKTEGSSKEVKNNFRRNEAVNPNALPQGVDPALQHEPATRAAAPTIQNFSGINGVTPPDPSGAAGPNHYMQAVNLKYRVYDKTGTPLSGALNLNTLWPGTSSEGDPIVMYDRHADRWFMSQFQFGPNRILIAISETPDPTGSWYAYSFTMGQFPDYPKYSIWWDGYYMTSNSNQTAVVFERDKMLAGDPTASMINLSAPGLVSAGFRSPLPADADGPLPPNGTPMYIFNLEDDSWGGVSQDRIRVWEMNTDWATPSNTSVVVSATVTTDPFDTNFGFGFDNISQPGSSQKLDAIPGVLMYRAQHMRWSGYNTVVLCHVVDVNGSNQAGMRWYELRDADDGNWSIYQQGTYSPDNANRWMGSISMDESGNIGMAYSYNNPSAGEGSGIRYTGRLAADALGTMSLFESNAISGSGAQTSSNRYGDYAHMTLDPDGTTLWYTGEYLTPTRRTRIFSFNVSSTLGIEDLDEGSSITLNAISGAQDVIVNATGLQELDGLNIELIDIHGRVIDSEAIKTRLGDVTVSFSMQQRSTGIYFVRLISNEVQKVQRILYSK